MLNLKSKKQAFAPIFIIFFVLLILIIIYVVLWAMNKISIAGVPLFPSATALFNMANYWLLLALWIIIQIGIIFAYYEVGKFIGKNILKLRTKFTTWTIKFRRYVIMRS
jgi:hypothetical protein